MNKHWLYLRYVIAHKRYVFLECAGVGLWWQGITHDWSKFLPDEWFPYVEKFYGGPHIKRADINPLMQEYPWVTEEAVKEAFDVAWNNHLHRQPHHWQHWLLKYDDGNIIPLRMPRRYALEMVCDWIGAARAQGKTRESVAGWYAFRAETMLLHPETRGLVEGLLVDMALGGGE